MMRVPMENWSPFDSSVLAEVGINLVEELQADGRTSVLIDTDRLAGVDSSDYSPSVAACILSWQAAIKAYHELLGKETSS